MNIQTKILTRLVALTLICLPTLNLSAAIITSFAFNGAVVSSTSQNQPGTFQLDFINARIAANPNTEPLAFNAWVQIDPLTLNDQSINGAFTFDQTFYPQGFRILDSNLNLLATADIDLSNNLLQLNDSNTTGLINELTQINLLNTTLHPAGHAALQNNQSPILNALTQNNAYALILTIPYASPQLYSQITSGLLDTSFAGSVAVIPIPEPTALALLLPLIASTTLRRKPRIKK